MKQKRKTKMKNRRKAEDEESSLRTDLRKGREA
jgi:hypothetical protein